MTEIVTENISNLSTSERCRAGDDLSAIVGTRGMQRYLGQRHLWVARRSLATPQAAATVLDRADRQEKSGKHDTVMVMESRSNRYIGMGTSMPGFARRELSMSLPPHPAVLAIPGVLKPSEEDGSNRTFVVAWVDPLRRHAPDEMTEAYAAMAEKSHEQGTTAWTFEPLRAKYTLAHLAITQAGFLTENSRVLLDTGEPNIHHVPYGNEYVSAPL